MDLSFAKRRRVYLMRHGEVEYFDGTGKPFRPDEVPLTPKGEVQARAAGEVMKSVAIDRVVVSPLLRTRQTADHVVGERAIPRVEIEDLREIVPGKLRDLPMDPESIRRIFTEAFGLDISREDTFLGGETFGSMLDRVRRAVDGLLADMSWKNLLIVAHGGVNRAILGRALGSELASFGRMEQDPACLNIIDIDPQGRMLVRLLNWSATNPVKQGHRLTTMEDLFAQYLGLTIPTED